MNRRTLRLLGIAATLGLSLIGLSSFTGQRTVPAPDSFTTGLLSATAGSATTSSRIRAPIALGARNDEARLRISAKPGFID